MRTGDPDKRGLQPGDLPRTIEVAEKMSAYEEYHPGNDRFTTTTGGTWWGNSGVGVILGPGQFNFEQASFERSMEAVRPAEPNFILKDDTLYSVDSQSDEKTNSGVKRGIRLGSAKNGRVKAFIPDLSTDPQIALAEGVSADAKGNIYAAGVSSMALHKSVKK